VTDRHLAEGLVVDADADHIYWTNMGVPERNDGSTERASLDGKNLNTTPYGTGHVESAGSGC
jgi:hypothetical protein